MQTAYGWKRNRRATHRWRLAWRWPFRPWCGRLVPEFPNVPTTRADRKPGRTAGALVRDQGVAIVLGKPGVDRLSEAMGVLQERKDDGRGEGAPPPRCRAFTVDPVPPGQTPQFLARARRPHGATLTGVGAVANPAHRHPMLAATARPPLR
jgi:hypothetical protein